MLISYLSAFTARIFYKNIPPEVLLSKMSAHSLAVSRGEAGNWLEKFDKGQINDDVALLIEGKILDYAKVVLPPEKFASCYNDIPDDLIRDVIYIWSALSTVSHQASRLVRAASIKNSCSMRGQNRQKQRASCFSSF